MTSVPSDIQIYPDYCHALSSTIGKWCPLRAIDVFALRNVGMFCDGRPLYHHDNHPIKWVRLTGVVVAADEYAGRRVYTLDDSSGMCIECTAVAPPEAKSAISVPIPRHLDQLAALNRVGTSAVRPNAITMTTEGKNMGTGKEAPKQPPSVQEPLVPWEAMDVGAVVKVKGKIGEFREIKQIEVIKIEIMKGLDAEVKCWNEVMAFRVDVLSQRWVVSEEEEDKCRKGREKEMRRAKRVGRDARGKEEGRKKRRGAHAEALGREEQERARRKRAREAEMLPPPLPPKKQVKYPSLAVRKAAAGKYDALGI